MTVSRQSTHFDHVVAKNRSDMKILYKFYRSLLDLAQKFWSLETFHAFHSFNRYCCASSFDASQIWDLQFMLDFVLRDCILCFRILWKMLCSNPNLKNYFGWQYRSVGWMKPSLLFHLYRKINLCFSVSP